MFFPSAVRKRQNDCSGIVYGSAQIGAACYAFMKCSGIFKSEYGDFKSGVGKSLCDYKLPFVAADHADLYITVQNLSPVPQSAVLHFPFVTVYVKRRNFDTVLL